MDLVERGAEETYNAYLANGHVLVIIARLYPSISQLYNGPNSGQVLRQLFRILPGYCVAPAIQEAPVVPGPNPPGLTGMQTEHPLDVSAPSFHCGWLLFADATR